MRSGGEVGSGVVACEVAFQRLIDGAPVVAQHVGIDPSKVTAGIVSVEAGFDRGYLKKSRKYHQPLIAKIEAYRADSLSRNKIGSHNLQYIKRAQSKLASLEAELKIAVEQRDIVLAQNLQLYERIRDLEKNLARLHPRIG
ncbi:hypothetical protein D3C84_952480 [compost metagenome]